jgi:EAL domain-containing protein (putative c-di-GMP-specific phosphodiesterase class I)
MAEETGLIIPIDRWVLREACRQMQAWHKRFPQPSPLTINVNLSARQFSQPDLIKQIEEILTVTGLEASSLKLEITESVIMSHVESASQMLSQLRALGIKIHLDDFGTGYSSLSYLHRFPIDALKIDRAFVSRIDVGGENPEIVRAIITLAHNLGMDVVAEGVESVEQLAQLKALGCEYGQGNLFSKPLPAVAAERLISTSPTSAFKRGASG